tara:strand:+ start:327 stop:530 length:204 start_codon:yes stop_codon:yes gene_type:complete
MTTTDLNEWVYMFTICKGMRSADIFIRNRLEDEFRVVCLDRDDPREIVEDVTLDYCREVGENFVMGR